MSTFPRLVEMLPHDRSHLLCEGEGFGNPTKLLLESIDRWACAMVGDDSARGGSFGEYFEGTAVAKQNGVIAGRFAVDRMVNTYFPSISLTWLADEGRHVSGGEAVLSMGGPSESVLKCERVLLNIIGRMSGIATETSEWVQTSGGLPVACTRKTQWGLLDKWAVHVGGGLTHRLSRKDALMIKENDLVVLGSGSSEEDSVISSVVSQIDLSRHASFTVIEVSNTSQALEAASSWVDCQKVRGGDEKVVLLLDNMGPQVCNEAASLLIGEGLREWCILEGSGGIAKGDLDVWASQSGVDLVSTSAVNMGVAPLDISFTIGGT
jgi:nicotinate-nucleotide pyrophosphorylase (carboxylating)